MPRIAEIDRAILAQLRKNGRMSYVDLASRLRPASARFALTSETWKKTAPSVATPSVKRVGLTALVRIKVSQVRKSVRLPLKYSDGKVEIVRSLGEADLVALVHVDDTMALQLSDKMWLADRTRLPPPRNWSWNSTESYSSSDGGE